MYHYAYFVCANSLLAALKRKSIPEKATVGFILHWEGVY